MVGLQQPADPDLGPRVPDVDKDSVGEHNNFVRFRDLRRVRQEIHQLPQCGTGRVIASGSDPGVGVTSLVLNVAGLALGAGEPGVPVSYPAVLQFVAVSFLGSNASGPWTLTLHHRPAGSSFSPVATFTVNTSPP